MGNKKYKITVRLFETAEIIVNAKDRNEAQSLAYSEIEKGNYERLEEFGEEIECIEELI